MKKKIVLMIAIILFILILGILIYIKFSNESYVKLIINGQVFLFDDNTDIDAIDLETFNTQYDTEIKIELKYAKAIINGKKIKKTSTINLGKIEIDKESKISVEVRLFGKSSSKTYNINTLPTTFPEFTIEGESETDGEFYITTYRISKYKNEKHYIYKLNKFGEVTYYKQTESTPYNFKKNEIDGKVRYTYLEATNQRYSGIISSIPTTLIVMNENYDEINRIKYPLKDGEEDVDCHDYIYIDDNHYIISSYTQELVKNVPGKENEEIAVYNSRIEEVKDGKILWEFQSINHEELYAYYSEQGMSINSYSNKLYIDYMHINSMTIDPEDNNLVCSFRNIDALIKIDRATGGIIWILGGKGDQFGLTNEQKFSKQHSAYFLSDHSIILYDNGEDKESTRVVIIKLDEKNKKIKEYKSYPLDIYMSRMGSVRTINEEKNEYLITFGIGKTNRAFSEINIENLETTFEMTLSGSNALYCVNKYDM